MAGEFATRLSVYYFPNRLFGCPTEYDEVTVRMPCRADCLKDGVSTVKITSYDCESEERNECRWKRKASSVPSNRAARGNYAQERKGESKDKTSVENAGARGNANKVARRAEDVTEAIIDK